MPSSVPVSSPERRRPIGGSARRSGSAQARRPEGGWGRPRCIGRPHDVPAQRFGDDARLHGCL